MVASVYTPSSNGGWVATYEDVTERHSRVPRVPSQVSGVVDAPSDGERLRRKAAMIDECRRGRKGPKLDALVESITNGVQDGPVRRQHGDAVDVFSALQSLGRVTFKQ